jgi:hypothetical protein
VNNNARAGTTFVGAAPGEPIVGIAIERVTANQGVVAQLDGKDTPALTRAGSTERVVLYGVAF